jgi:two-component system NarL family sensor kinase
MGTMEMPRRRAAGLTAGVALALFVAALAFAVVSIRGGSHVEEWTIAGFTPGYVVAGYLLARQRPDLPFGWVYLAAALLSAGAGLGAAYCGAALAQHWPGAAWGIWFTAWAFPLEGVLAALVMLYFPAGRIRSSLWRRLTSMLVVVVGLSSLLTMIMPGLFVLIHATSPAVHALRNPAGINAVAPLRGLRDALRPVADRSLTLASIVVFVRFLRAHGALRGQLRGLALFNIGLPVVFMSIIAFAQPLFYAATLGAHLVQAGIVTFTIVRWRVLGVDVAVRRSVLAAALLVAALGTYAAIVALVGAAVGTTGPVVSAVGATAAVFAFAPLSLRIRGWVNQLFYGRTKNPYAVVASLGQRLSAAPGPEDGVRGLVDTLVEELRLPFVEVISASGELVTGRGELEPGDEPLEFALDHQGVRVGTLRVGHRRGQADISAQEQALLVDLARQVGAAVQAVAMLEDLRHARERLVVAREDERRRLQRDLHDGLGPQLTAMSLKVDAARNLLHRDPEAAAALLTETASETRSAVKDVRRLVYALGDPALDSLGLVAALRDQTERLQRASDGFRVSVQADEPIGPLPAAVEIAAFRIASEAINNAVRHAGGHHCRVSLHADGALHLVVEDDGQGLPEPWSPGVGVLSMRERCAELGGLCDIGPSETGGTRVAVVLPLPGLINARD